MMDWNAVAIHLEDAIFSLKTALEALEGLEMPQELEILRDEIEQTKDDMERLQEDVDIKAEQQNREEEADELRAYYNSVL